MTASNRNRSSRTAGACIGALSAFLALLSGCTSFHGLARIEEGWQGAGTPFQGLATGAPENGNGHHTVVFYTHGIGPTKEAEFDKDLRDWGARITGGDWSEPSSAEVALARPWLLRGEGLNCTMEPEQCFKTSFGKLTVRTFKLGPGLKDSVTFYSYYWNEAARQIQVHYGMSCSARDPGYCDKKEPYVWLRAYGNRKLKDTVMVDGISDATLYAGGAGPLMRAGLQAAICMALRHEVADDPSAALSQTACTASDLIRAPGTLDRVSRLDFRLVAKSLGSRMVFDTLMPFDEMAVIESKLYSAAAADVAVRNRPPLLRFTQDNVRALLPNTPEEIERSGDVELKEAYAGIELKKALTRSLVELYLLANQLPLLGLSGIVATDPRSISARDAVYCVFVASDSTCSESPLAHPATEREIARAKDEPTLFSFASAARGGHKLKVIAFRDVNDLLGYRAGVHFSPTAKALADFIEVRHQNASVFLFLFAWPQNAHAAEDDRADSAAMIWCGAVAVPSGNLKARSCVTKVQ